MKPVLFDVDQLEFTSYGLGKALAVLVGGWLLARELRHRGRDPELAWSLAFVRRNDGFVLGLTQSQLWSPAPIALGAALACRELASGRVGRLSRAEART